MNLIFGFGDLQIFMSKFENFESSKNFSSLANEFSYSPMTNWRGKRRAWVPEASEAHSFLAWILLSTVSALARAGFLRLVLGRLLDLHPSFMSAWSASSKRGYIFGLAGLETCQHDENDRTCFADEPLKHIDSRCSLLYRPDGFPL